MSQDDAEKKKNKARYAQQKAQAKQRGIGWQLTFDEWVTWWGEDISLRGSHSGGLQMQRFGDDGPYALGNIKKGRPAENSATWSRVCANRKAKKAAKDHQAFLDALMWAESKPEPDDDIDEADAPRKNGPKRAHTFAADKKV